MNTESLVEKIKNQFITNVDAGLLFKIHSDEFNTCFFFEDDEKDIYSRRRTNRFDYETVNKQDAYRYLTAKFLKATNISYHYLISYESSEFYEKFWTYWLERFEKIKNTLSLVSKYYSAENTVESDLVITNAYVNTYDNPIVKIYIINQKYITEILINSINLDHRVEHKIQRDIKRIEAVSAALNVYFHGIHTPFSINLDSYEEVIKLQRKLLELKDNNQSQNFRRR